MKREQLDLQEAQELQVRLGLDRLESQEQPAQLEIPDLVLQA
ncbi:hypothetical protein ABGV40_25150 [Paenibacillus amylolyticus]